MEHKDFNFQVMESKYYLTTLNKNESKNELIVFIIN